MRRLLACLLLLPTAAFADTALLHVSGMHCTSCALKLEAALLENPTIATAHVNVEAGTVAISSKADAELDPRALETIVTETGYKVTDVKVSE